MLEYEPVGVLSTEVERLREGILTQLQALRWQVVDFSITDALRSVSELDGVVELRLRVSSNVWRESAEAERQKRMEQECEEKRIAEVKQQEEEQQIREAEERQQQQDQARADEEAKERQRTLENEEKENRAKESDVAAASSTQDGLRLHYEWEATKEKARQKVFDAVRKEQDRRMLFALNLRESFGLKRMNEPRHIDDHYSLPFETPSSADDPFPVGSITLTSSRVPDSPRIAEDAVNAIPGVPGAFDGVRVRAVSLHTRRPARNWQAELRPGLVFVADARLSGEASGVGAGEEWLVGRTFGDESGPRRAVPAELLYVLHGDVRLLRRKLLSELLWNENIGEDKEEEVVALAVPARQEVEPLQDERKLPPLPPAVQMPVAATGENEEQVRRNEAVEAVERERVREREAERKKAQEEQERQARESERRQEEARRKSENERKASQELPVVNAKPPSADSADKSRAALTAGAYNMMPVPVMSGEIAAAIRERGRRKSANLGADVVEKPDSSQREVDRRRSATAAILMHQSQPQPSVPAADASATLRPPPPSRLSRRSLDPSAAPLTASKVFASSDASAVEPAPPLPPLPTAALPPVLPPTLMAKSGTQSSSSLPAVTIVNAGAAAPNVASLARDKRLSLPAHVLHKRNEEAIAAAAAAAGPPPPLPGATSSSPLAPSPAHHWPGPKDKVVPPASAASSDALSTRDQRKSWSAPEETSGVMSSSASAVTTAAGFQAKREALGMERQRSATVLGAPPAATAATEVPQRTASSSALQRSQTMRATKSKDKVVVDKEERKKDKEEKKKRKEEEKEKKRKEKEKKKEDKKKKKTTSG